MANPVSPLTRYGLTLSQAPLQFTTQTGEITDLGNTPYDRWLLAQNARASRVSLPTYKRPSTANYGPSTTPIGIPSTTAPTYDYGTPTRPTVTTTINPVTVPAGGAGVTTPTPSALPSWMAYFQGNPDVSSAYAQNTYGLTPEQFANAHYKRYGAVEGRAWGNTQNTAASSAAQTYFNANPDVAAAYANNNLNMTPEQFAQKHYLLHGSKEGRNWTGPAPTSAIVSPLTQVSNMAAQSNTTAPATPESQGAANTPATTPTGGVINSGIPQNTNYYEPGKGYLDDRFTEALYKQIGDTVKTKGLDAAKQLFNQYQDHFGFSNEDYANSINHLGLDTFGADAVANWSGRAGPMERARDYLKPANQYDSRSSWQREMDQQLPDYDMAKYGGRPIQQWELPQANPSMIDLNPTSNATGTLSSGLVENLSSAIDALNQQGRATDAQRLYQSAQDTYGFSNDQFSSMANNLGVGQWTPSRLDSWAGRAGPQSFDPTKSQQDPNAWFHTVWPTYQSANTGTSATQGSQAMQSPVAPVPTVTTPATGTPNTTAGQEPAWQQYLNANPDVMNAYAQWGNNKPLEQYAREHYDKFGQAEGRQWYADGGQVEALKSLGIKYGMKNRSNLL